MDKSSADIHKPADPDLLFQAMADPTRRRLLQLLAFEELNVSEIVDILGQPQSTVSRHLRVLRRAELVNDRRQGASVLYVAAGGAQPSAIVNASAEAPPRSDADVECDLPAMILNWLSHHSLPAVMNERLQRVLQHRRTDASRFFNRLGDRWDELRDTAFGSAFVTEAFIPLLPRDWIVADVGTGTGSLLPILADHFQQVIAVDPAETMLACAKQRVEDHGSSNVTLHLGDLAKLPIGDACVDLAIAMLVIHHVRKPEEALAQMYRIVRPGGRVLIVEQEAHENQTFYERMQDLWWGFDSENLGRQLTATGFSNVRHHPLAATGRAAADSPRLFVLAGERPEA
ncbi:MAG: ArsR/SmtB family transcription factor [Phycisphaerae bacterium]